MVQFNFAERTIKAKVVYYGPAQSGKTTNLEHIHRLTDPAGNNRLISLNTAQDRTLFFDLLPFSLGAVSGYDFKIQLYTVPGQVQYNATRRLVLRGADGLVFVADSQFERLRENVESLRNLETNLREYESTLDDIPYVLQYNKRDLSKLAPVTYLEFVLNRRATRVPFFEASAIEGRGVFDTLNTVSRMALASEFGGKRERRDEAS